MKEGAGDNRGRPFVLGFVDRFSLDGRYGRVDAMMGRVLGIIVRRDSAYFGRSGQCKPKTQDPRSKRWFRGQKKTISTAGAIGDNSCSIHDVELHGGLVE